MNIYDFGRDDDDVESDILQYLYVDVSCCVWEREKGREPNLVTIARVRSLFNYPKKKKKKKKRQWWRIQKKKKKKKTEGIFNSLRRFL